MKIDKEEILQSLDIRAFYKSLIPSLKETGKGQALGLCPFHDDHNPSLSVNLEDGLYKCFSCDAKGDVFKFYQNLKDKDFPTALQEIAEIQGITGSAVKQKVVATYEYKDPKGKTLYIKERVEPGKNGRSKEFRFKHTEGGKWVSGRGCDPVPYNLPELVKSKYAIIVEGEGKVDLLKSWGLVATCLDSGANSPWKDEYTNTLKDKEKVAILPDNDSPGRSYASKIANALNGKVGSLKVVELPGLEEAEDVIDWAKKEGNDKAKLLELMKEALAWEPAAEPYREETGLKEFDPYSVMDIADDLRNLDVKTEYIVEGLIPKGLVTILYARSGMGKSTLMTQLCQAISTAQPFMGLNTVKTPSVYLDFENGLPTIVDRFKKFDSLPFHIWHCGSKTTPPPLDKAAFIQYLKLNPGSVVIFDTLKACNDADENKANDMKIIMDRFKTLRALGLTVIILHHTTKASDTTHRGSSVIQDQVDHCLVLHKVKNTASDEEIDDDDLNIYKLGTKFKTRAKPFKMYLQFDKERELFKSAEDPDNVYFEELHSLITRLKESTGDAPNTSSIQKEVKTAEIALSKNKVESLLRKGEGKYWTRTTLRARRNAIVYDPLPVSQFSTPIYSGETGKLPESVLSRTEKPNLNDSTGSNVITEFPTFSGGLQETEKLDLYEGTL